MTSDTPTHLERPVGARSDPEATEASTQDDGAPSGDLAPPLHELIPEYLQGWTRYRIDDRLGQGGMGEVFRAYDPQLKRFVALKFLHSTDSRSVARFRTEAEAQARVDHPNVCRVYEVGEVAGRPFIAMQQIDGHTLGEIGLELRLEEKVLLIEQIAAGLHAAHRIGLIHRDVKPGNVLVERRPRGDLHPYLVDFGLVRDARAARGLTVTGAVSGTPGYMSPEQAMGSHAIDRRSDVYSLGVILWEILAGQRLVEADTFLASIALVVEREAPPLQQCSPQVPTDLATIVHKCLEKDPIRRYDSARALAEDLRRFLDGDPVHAQPPSTIYRIRKGLTRNPALSWTASIGLFATLVLTGFAVWTHQRAEQKAALAQHFGRETEALVSAMQQAERLPLHDLNADRVRILERMDGIESEMETLGPEARPPGHAALGKAALALGHLDEARVHLERAIALGEDSLDTRSALATTLDAQYERALPATARHTDSEARALHRNELAREFLHPAIGLLARPSEEAELPAILRARVALWRSDYSVALEIAEDAVHDAPWQPELHQLIGRIHRSRAQDAVESGDEETARMHLLAAEAAYAQSIQIARSDPDLRLEECARQEEGLRWNLLPRTQASVQRALESCQHVLTIEPLEPAAWIESAAIVLVEAEERLDRGQSPESRVEEALGYARLALELDPMNPTPHRLRGLANQLRARSAQRTGADPLPHFQDAIRSLLQARRLAPGDPGVLNTLGNTLFAMARHQIQHGLSATEALHDARKSYETALATWPDHSIAWANLGATLVALAETDLDRGEDPTAFLEEAARAFEASIEIHPRRPATHNNRGNSYLTLADYRLRRGLDAESAITRAIDSYRAALELRPDYSYAHYNIAFANRLRALGLLRRNLSPNAALEAARTALAAAASVDPTDPDNALERLRVELLALRWSQSSGVAEDSYRSAARAALRQGLELNPRLAALHREAAELALWSVSEDGRLRSATLETGLASCLRALAIRPDYAEALVTQAALLEAKALGAPAPERNQLLDQAHESLLAAEILTPWTPPEAQALRQRIAEAQMQLSGIELAANPSNHR